MARHIPHLYLASPWHDDRIDLDAEARQHLEKVLRMQTPAAVTYTDGAGLVGSGVFERHFIRRGKEEKQQRVGSITVAVAPPKNNSRVRFVVEKLSEIGVERLVWLRSQYTEGKPPKTEKSAAWSIGALEQSRGAWRMEIVGPISVDEIAGFGDLVFADPDGGTLSDFQPGTDVVLCVGPEGGFASEEIPEGSELLSFGPTVLRVETAAVVGAALLINHLAG